MRNVFLRLLACLLAAAILISVAAIPAFADENEADADVQTDEVDTAEPAEGETEEPADAEAPAEGEEAPAEGEEAPAEGEEAPAEGEEAPADGEEAPAEGEEAPAEGEEAPAEGEEAPADGEAGDEESEFDATVPLITDEEALATCQVAAENDDFILYYDPGVEDAELERIGIFVKETGELIWTNPINALADTSTNKSSLRENRLSNLSYKYGNATDLITSSAFLYSYRQSTSRGNTKMEPVEGGLKVTYRLQTANATVPLYIKLEDGYIDVYINTDEIKESNGYDPEVEDDQSKSSDTIILTQLGILPYVGAATEDQEGYMLIPDGSGAVINFNNGKGTYADYTQPVYGRDITQVRENAPDQTEQANLPVMAMVYGKTGLVTIAAYGDTFAQANASVAYSKNENSWYNSCYFSFTLRSNDNYYMTGDSTAIIVFEKGDGTIGVPKVGVRLYPVVAKGDTVTVAEIADVYRNYLIEEKGLTKKEGATEPALYIDFYGGTRKSKSILGVPVGIKTAFTPFDEATEIVDTLRESGADSIVVNYNDWTEDSMDPKIDTGDSVASVLGGKGAYKKMIKAFNDSGVDYYATVSGITFESNGNGFWTLFNTAYRVSKSYSRQYTYNIAYGTPDSGIAPALLSPRSIEKLSNKVTKNLSKFDQGAGLGLVSTTLWSDFSNKYRTNRSATAKYITDYYEAANEACGKTIADSPNAFLIPHVTRIKNLTLQSSQYKLIDVDIDYSCEAINGTPDTTIAVLKAIAAGSNIHFDFISEEATELVNTDYVNLFYCTAEGWLDEAAKAYQLVSEVLTPAAGATISDYKVENDGKLLTPTYSNGYETVVDLDARTVKAGGKTYSYAEYVKGGSK